MTDEIIALDLETTGLNPRTDSILEIGAVRIKNGRVEDTYAAFINIGKKIPEFIVGLTGITDEMAAPMRMRFQPTACTSVWAGNSRV